MSMIYLHPTSGVSFIGHCRVYQLHAGRLHYPLSYLKPTRSHLRPYSGIRVKNKSSIRQFLGGTVTYDHYAVEFSITNAF